MKRSHSLSLIIMGSLLLPACGQEPQSAQEELFATFTSVQECDASGLFSEKECRELAIAAVAQSPRFSSQAECEEAFGPDQCNSINDPKAATSPTSEQTVERSSGSMWMPMMMGYMAGRMMGGGGYMQGSQPLYKDPAAPKGTSSYRTAGGDVVRPDAKGRVSNPPAKIKQSLSHNAKPVMSRTGGSRGKGGFSGSSRFGGSSGS